MRTSTGQAQPRPFWVLIGTLPNEELIDCTNVAILGGLLLFFFPLSDKSVSTPPTYVLTSASAHDDIWCSIRCSDEQPSSSGGCTGALTESNMPEQRWSDRFAKAPASLATPLFFPPVLIRSCEVLRIAGCGAAAAASAGADKPHLKKSKPCGALAACGDAPVTEWKRTLLRRSTPPIASRLVGEACEFDGETIFGSPETVWVSSIMGDGPSAPPILPL